jgi:transcriptional regulator with XRE-family HTH domain
MGKRVQPRARRFRSLAAYLEASDVSQMTLAAQVGISQAHISRIAAGLVVPAPALAVRLATLTGVPLASFTRAYLARHEESEVSE